MACKIVRPSRKYNTVAHLASANRVKGPKDSDVAIHSWKMYNVELTVIWSARLVENLSAYQFSHAILQ